jgi:hypothetical protein
MAVTVRIGPDLATVDAGRWACPNGPLRRILQSFAVTNPPHGGVPDLDYELARYALSQTGGEIVARDMPTRTPGRIY